MSLVYWFLAISVLERNISAVFMTDSVDSHELQRRSWILSQRLSTIYRGSIEFEKNGEKRFVSNLASSILTSLGYDHLFNTTDRRHNINMFALYVCMILTLFHITQFLLIYSISTPINSVIFTDRRRYQIINRIISFCGVYFADLRQ